MDAPPQPARPRRSLARRIGCSVLLALGLAVLAIELLSRAADGVVARRAAEPGHKPNEEPRGLFEKLCHDTLEYGSPKRAAEQVHGARVEPHPYLGYALRPSWSTPPGAPQQAAHNALGFRGRETTWAKPPGTFRICTTGGSSVYGQSESCDAAVWSEQLEIALNAAGPEKRIEVVNLGTMGWTSSEMVVNLALRGLDLAPDLVIVYEAVNDMRAALYNIGGPVQRDNTHWRAVWPVDRPSRLEELFARSRTYLVWRRYATSYVQGRVDLGFFAMVNFRRYLEDPTLDLYLHEPGPVPELGFELYRRNLVQMIALCRARGADVAIATQALPRWHLQGFRSRQQQVDGFERIQAIQREVAAEHSVLVCESALTVEAACEAELAQRIAAEVAARPERPRAEIERDLRATKRRDLLFFAEVHPNDRGSELLARTIAEWLLACDLVPR